MFNLRHANCSCLHLVQFLLSLNKSSLVVVYSFRNFHTDENFKYSLLKLGLGDEEEAEIREILSITPWQPQ